MSLVCEENFGSGTLTERTAVSPSRQSSPVSAIFSFPPDGLVGVAGDLARQRAAEAGKVGAAVALRDVVGEAEDVLVIRVVPLHGDLDGDAVALGADVDRRRDDRLLGAVEIAREGLEAAVVHHRLGLHLDAALVGQGDLHAGIQERQLAQAMLERGVVEFDVGKRLRRGRERHLGAVPPVPVADFLQRRVGHAVGEGHLVDLALAPDAELQLLRQRIDHGDADAVQAAGDLVGILVELTAGVQLGHDDLGRRNAFALVDAGRDAAAVVPDRHRAVGVERHRHRVGIAGERLVDAVVDDLVDHVMQAGAVIGVADIHARALAHGVEALQDLDGFGAVFAPFGDGFHFVHGCPDA